MKLMRMSLNINYWIVLILITTGVLSKGPDFIALDKPCLDAFRLCSTACSVSRMTGDLDCEFCVCDDPDNVIIWPETTTRTTTTTTPPPPTTTLSPGQWSANNITYVDLQNPCIEYEASCPILCKSWNTTYEGRKCERCLCVDNPGGGKIFGKRMNGIQPYLKYPGPPSGGSNNGQGCVPLFACPIFQCHEGEMFDTTPDGCRICKCVPDPHHGVHQQALGGSINHTPMVLPGRLSELGPHFLKTFCRDEPEECPSDCNVVDYRVGNWHCYHCSCPNKTYTALQQPCNERLRLCSDVCKIRTLVDPENNLMTCQYCDCQQPFAGRRKRQMPYFTCQACHICVGDMSFGRRKRQNDICNHPICQNCRNNKDRQTTTAPDPIQQTTTGHVTISVEDLSQNCLPNVDICPTVCHHFTVNNCILCLCRDKFLSMEKINSIVHVINPHAPATQTKQTTTQTAVVQPTTLQSTTTQTAVAQPTTLQPTTEQPIIVQQTTIQQATVQPAVNIQSTTVPKTDSCYTCSGLSCKEKDLTSCQVGVDYCMNTIQQDNAGLRKITRSCVTEEDCYNKWWSISADSSTCISMTDSVSGPVGEDIVCNFCCKGTGCNKLGRIPNEKLYTGESHPTADTIIVIG